MAIGRLWLLALLLLWTAAATAHPPYSLVEDRQGNVYFSDLETVWRLAPDGRLERFRPRAGDSHVHELALAPDGAVEGDSNRYDASTQTYWTAVWRRTPNGREIWVMRWTTAPPKGMGLLQDKHGNRYTAQWRSNDDRRTMLFRRTRGGKVELLHGDARAAARFRQSAPSSIGGMAWLADGSLVFADSRVLRRFTPGAPLATLYQGGPGANFRGVAAAADSRVLAADMGRREVVAVSADGRADILYRSPPEWLPTAALQARGRLLVLEANADPYQYQDRVRVVAVRGGAAQEVARPVHGPVGRSSAPQAEAEKDLPVGAAAGALAAVSAAGIVFWLRRRRSGGPAG